MPPKKSVSETACQKLLDNDEVTVDVGVDRAAGCRCCFQINQKDPIKNGQCFGIVKVVDNFGCGALFDVVVVVACQRWEK